MYFSQLMMRRPTGLPLAVQICSRNLIHSHKKKKEKKTIFHDFNEKENRGCSDSRVKGHQVKENKIKSSQEDKTMAHILAGQKTTAILFA